MKKWKSIFVIICFMAFFTFFSTQVQAEELWEKPDWEMELLEQRKEIEGYKYAEYKEEIYILMAKVWELEGNELVIPETIDGKPVVAFAVCGDLDDNYQKIVIPKYLEYFKLLNLGTESTTPSEYVVAEGNDHFKVVNKILYSKDGKTLVASPKGVNSSLRIPNGVTKINACAFSGSRDIYKVVMPDTVIEIGYAAFKSSDLEVIKLSKNLRKIGDTAFSSCAKLKKISLPSKLKTIGQYAFASTDIKTLSIPKSVKEIGPYAFSNNKRLKKVTFSSKSKVTVLEKEVFKGCEKLKTITLPSKLKRIKSKAFAGCSNLRKIKIPAKVTKIADDAFAAKGEKIDLTVMAKKKSYAYKYAKHRRKRGLKMVAL